MIGGILLLLQIVAFLSLIGTAIGILIDLTLRAVSGNHFTSNMVNTVLTEVYSVTGVVFIMSLTLSIIISALIGN